MSSFVCRIDETQQGGPTDSGLVARDFSPDFSPEAVIVSVAATYAAGVDSLAREVLFARESLALGLVEYGHKHEWLHRLSYLAFACEHPSRPSCSIPDRRCLPDDNQSSAGAGDAQLSCDRNAA